MIKINTRVLVTISLLIALQIILAKFLGIHTQYFKIGFGFVPIFVAAILYGPIGGITVGILSDIVANVLFPVGPYFPGFALTEALEGVTYGILLRKKHSLSKVVISVIVTQLALSQFLNTYWLHVLYGAPYWEMFYTRIIQTSILFVVELIVIFAISKFRKYFIKLA